jgi:hypothetical protein
VTAVGTSYVDHPSGDDDAVGEVGVLHGDDVGHRAEIGNWNVVGGKGIDVDGGEGNGG